MSLAMHALCPRAKGHEHVLIRPLALHQAVRVELLNVLTPDRLVVANAIVDRRLDRASWDVLASYWLVTSRDDSRQRQSKTGIGQNDSFMIAERYGNLDSSPGQGYTPTGVDGRFSSNSWQTWLRASNRSNICLKNMTREPYVVCEPAT
jgi:hypothetical protein